MLGEAQAVERQVHALQGRSRDSPGVQILSLKLEPALLGRADPQPEQGDEHVLVQSPLKLAEGP